MAYHGECQLVLVVEVRRRCIHWVRAAFHGQLIIVKTYPVNDPSIRVLACRLINSLNDEISLILENAVTTIRLRDAIHPSLEMLQNTHENAVTTLVAYKTRTRTR